MYNSVFFPLMFGEPAGMAGSHMPPMVDYSADSRVGVASDTIQRGCAIEPGQSAEAFGRLRPASV